MKKFQFEIIKCHPNLIEEKLNEAGQKGFELKFMGVEQQIHKLTNEIQSVSVLFMQKEIQTNTDKPCQD